MTELRAIEDEEKAILTVLLARNPKTSELMASLNEMRVAPMRDGAMGSLSLVPLDSRDTDRKFGREIVLGEFTDVDGVLASVAVNVDQHGDLYELDVWKVDFSPLLRWPDSEALRILN